MSVFRRSLMILSKALSGLVSDFSHGIITLNHKGSGRKTYQDGDSLVLMPPTNNNQ